MSVIQKIQDKYGKLMAVIIGISLVMFVVMLAFENGGSLFNSTSSTVGKVNGTAIDMQEYQGLVAQQTAMMEQQGMAGEGAAQQANEAAWNMEVSKILLHQEAEKLGLAVGDKELTSWIYSNNPPQDFRQAFSDPNTGQYNPTLAAEQFKTMKAKGTPEQKAQINAFLDQMALQRLVEKYDALLTSSINHPKWMLEKQQADAGLISKVSFVKEPYTSISDSAVKVTDAEIQDYINKNKDDFKTKESRSINYVLFSAQPTAQDSVAAREKILALKPAFDSTKDMKAYLTTQGMANTYYDGYISGSRIQVPNKDSIFKAGAGNVYGPYVDGQNYALAKIIGTKSMPDTVKIRHILVGLTIQDPQSGQQIPIRDDSTAKNLADSLFTAIKGGSNFDSLVVKFSTDQGSAANGGVYENVPSGQMVPEFNDYIFGNPTGSKGIVKTNFGYHIIEILSQKGSGTGYKIAYINKPINASQETDMSASNAATDFAAKVKDIKSFDAEADKLQKSKGLFKAVANDIAPMASNIQGIGNSRAFVKSIYKGKLGDIIQPERVGDAYVVGVVTDITEEGTLSAAKARMYVAPLLINKKKAELIAKKIGKVTTLEAAASVLGKTIETADSVRFEGTSSTILGFEPKVVGASFNKANTGKVVPETIAGTQGVYVVRVDNLSSTPSAPANIEELRKMKYQQAKQQAQYQSLQVLQQAATIKDLRSKFY